MGENQGSRPRCHPPSITKSGFADLRFRPGGLTVDTGGDVAPDASVFSAVKRELGQNFLGLL